MDAELEKLQTELSTVYARFFQVATALEPAKHNQPGVCGDWSPKEVVAHLTGWDKSVQEFIADPDGFDPPYDVDTFNAKSVSERQHLSWDESIDELQAGFRGLQKVVSTVTADMRIYNRISEWLKLRREDYDLHAGQLQDWIQRNGDSSTQA
jgi:hypothetical protein